MEKKCDRCGKAVCWRQSKKGNWYLANKRSGKPHNLFCGDGSQFMTKATRLKSQMDKDFERAIAR